jgi:hypothetical protein
MPASDPSPVAGQNRALRDEFLRLLYERTQGNMEVALAMNDVGASLGLDPARTGRVVQYLVEAGLVRWAGMGGVISIQPAGVRAVEEPATPSGSIVIQGNVFDSQLMSGGRGNVQQRSASGEPLADFTAAVRAQLAALGLSTDGEQEADAQLSTIEGQLKSRRPNRSVLQAAVAAVVAILESAPGREIAEQLMRRVPDLLR